MTAHAQFPKQDTITIWSRHRKYTFSVGDRIQLKIRDGWTVGVLLTLSEWGFTTVAGLSDAQFAFRSWANDGIWKAMDE